jgi:ribosomal 50S subunit-recycling heat shock protein
MRLDLYLKKTCIVAQRSVAKAACDAGRVQLNGRAAKASATLAPGDVLHLQCGGRALELRVLDLPHGNVAKRDSGRYVEILRETRQDDS